MDDSSYQDRAAQNAARCQSSDQTPPVDSARNRTAPAERVWAQGKPRPTVPKLVAPAEPHTPNWRQWLRQLGTAGGISTLLHLAVLLALGLWMVQQHILELPQELLATVALDRDALPEALPSDMPVNPGADLPTISNGSGPAQDHSQTNVEIPEITTDNAPGEIHVQIGPPGPGVHLGPGQLPDLPPGFIPLDPTVKKKNLDEAMDQITQEIVQNLEKRRVLLIWCMDESESMQDDRQEIMARIGSVYQQLGLSNAAQGDALLTAVTSYGEKWNNYLERPTADIQAIAEAIRSIQNDPTGKEMMCAAILQTLATFQPLAKKTNRHIMLICVTDESGDPKSNEQYLEATVEAARSSDATLYFLGREAIFGYPYARMWHTDSQTRTRYWGTIDRGPETPFPEQLQIDGFHRRGDALPSGFGPYEQSRLCRETGGIFFLLPSPEVELVNREDRKYDHDSMLTYVPDLSSRQDYAAERDRSPLRALIWKIITDLNPYDPNIGDKIEMQFGFSNDPTQFVSAAQREVAQAQSVIQYLRDAQQALESVQAERNRESNGRWRANFDLLHAQTMAYRIRLQEYVAYLEAFQQTPKPVINKHGAALPANRWQVRPVARRITGNEHQAEIEQVTALLKQVVADHHDTPWAARAEFELKRPYGIDFEEGYVVPPHGPGGGGGGSRNPL